MTATLVSLLAEVESRDVARIWMYICTMVTCSIAVISYFIYRAVRHDQKFRERELEIKERAKERKFTEKMFREGGPVV